VQDWLAEQPFDYIQDWPANSPDLSPIENVWGIMAQRLSNRVFKSADKFKAAIIEEWDKIDYPLLCSLYKSVPARCQAVIDASGAQTKF
jgi:hypothetical protein